MNSVSLKIVRNAQELVCPDMAFRAPHYTVSSVGLLEEYVLASNGILFLDMLPEFSRSNLDALGRIARNTGHVTKVRIFASWAPCACGCEKSKCRCAEGITEHYMGRVADSIALVGELGNDGSGGIL